MLISVRYLGKAAEDLRKARNTSRECLARSLGCASGTIGRWIAARDKSIRVQDHFVRRVEHEYAKTFSDRRACPVERAHG